MVVRVSRTRFAARVLVAAAGVLVFSVLAPTLVDGDGEDSAAMFVMGARCAYKNEHGSIPRDLVDVLPFLEIITRSDCSIDRLEGDRYRVRLLARQRAYEIEIRYIGDPDTNREEYHVLDIRHRPIGERWSGRAE